MPLFKTQIFQIATILLTSLLSIACSNNNRHSFPKHLLGESGSEFDVHLSEEEQLRYLEITDSFYNLLLDKGISDDSSFSRFYEPRLITKDSILPRFKCSYDDSNITILTFAINGFYLSRKEIMFNKPIDSNGEMLFYNIYDEECNDCLIPYVFFQETKKICDIKTAYKENTISQSIFTMNKGSDNNSYYVFNTSLFLISPLRKDYFVNLPSLVIHKDTNQSLLIQELQDIKDSFYEKEIVAKEFINDKHFRESYVGNKFNYYCIKLDKTSVHIDYFRSFRSGFTLYFISINDIKIDTYSSLNDPIIHRYYFGENEISTPSVVEPVVQIDNDISFLSESYKKGLFTDLMAEDLFNAYPNGIIDEDSYKVEIENKTLEIVALHNDIIYL